MKRLASLVALASLLAVCGLASADPVLGKITYVRTVQGLSTQTYFETFRGGERADVLITGNGRSTLNVSIYDAAGRFVCGTTGAGDRIQAKWFPSSTQTYRIEVHNDGLLSNTYLITMY